MVRYRRERKDDAADRALLTLAMEWGLRGRPVAERAIGAKLKTESTYDWRESEEMVNNGPGLSSDMAKLLYKHINALRRWNRTGPPTFRIRRNGDG